MCISIPCLLYTSDEVEEARKAEAALADERATAERRAANLTAADVLARGSDEVGLVCVLLVETRELLRCV